MVPPLPRVPNEQITCLPRLHGDVVNPAVIPGGKSSCMTTPVAVAGPPFVTVTK
jgi:hypothetical protein